MRKLAIGSAVFLLGTHLLDQTLRLITAIRHEQTLRMQHDHLPTVRKYHDEARPK